MPVEPPTPADLSRIAEDFGFGLTEDEIGEYLSLGALTLDVSARLDQLPMPALAVKYPRARRAPSGRRGESEWWMGVALICYRRTRGAAPRFAWAA